MAQVVFEKAERDRLQRGGGGTDLGEDVDAVLLVFHHRTDAASLPLDALQPVQVALSVADIPVMARRPVGIMLGIRRPVRGRLQGVAHRGLRSLGVVRDPTAGSMLWKRRSRRLLPTTKTLDAAIAAPAIMGFRSPRAASGIAATL